MRADSPIMAAVPAETPIRGPKTHSTKVTPRTESIASSGLVRDPISYSFMRRRKGGRRGGDSEHFVELKGPQFGQTTGNPQKEPQVVPYGGDVGKTSGTKDVFSPQAFEQRCPGPLAS